MKRQKWARIVLIVIITIAIAIGMGKKICSNLYINAIDSMLPPIIQYDSEEIECSVNINYYAFFRDTDKKTYFGKLPDESSAIAISIPAKATIYVFPHTNDSVLISYRASGHKINFTIEGKNFNDHLEVLYQITENEVFNKTVELPEAS